MLLKPALALFQPDIAGNTGTLIRLSACLGTQLHIIEPAGFRTDERAFRRAGMDYADIATVTRHDDFNAFENWRKDAGGRLVLLTTKTSNTYLDHKFDLSDILLLGRESSGVPDYVVEASDAFVTIPMQEGARSLNQAISGAMVLSEALRQTNGFAL